MAPPVLFSRLSRAPRPSRFPHARPLDHQNTPHCFPTIPTAQAAESPRFTHARGTSAEHPHVFPHNIPHNITTTPAPPLGLLRSCRKKEAPALGDLAAGAARLLFCMCNLRKIPRHALFYMRQKRQICGILRHVQHSHNAAYYDVHTSGIRAPLDFPRFREN